MTISAGSGAAGRPGADLVIEGLHIQGGKGGGVSLDGTYRAGGRGGSVTIKGGDPHS